VRKTLSFENFQVARYFPELDGLRTVSILLVVSLHTTDPLWEPLRGNVGVTIFFVISGFLITTLLLREEVERGGASIRAFYIRRAFRILPVYYVALVAYVVLIGVLDLKAGAADLWHALPYYLTYQNDFAPMGSGFGHTWSLAIEEKYYLVWPLTFSIVTLRSHRLPITLALIVLTSVASLSSRGQYLATYAPILCGCLVALLMHKPSTYEILCRLATTPLLVVLVGLLVLQSAVFETDNTGHVHVVFGALVALAMPGVLIGPTWVKPLFNNRVARYIGTRSYAVYLIHRMAKGVVDRLIAQGGTAGTQVARLVLIVSVSLVAAEIMYRFIERPMIRIGRELARAHQLPVVRACRA